MRIPTLTSRSSKDSETGRLTSIYEYKGECIPVCDSAQDAVRLFALLKCEDIEPADKSRKIFALVFPKPETYLLRSEEEARDLLAYIAWEAYGLDITEDHVHSSECETPVFDFEEDAARIKASLLAYYGLNWDEISAEMTYPDFCALLGQITEADRTDSAGGLPNFKTPFAQAVFYRTAKPPTGKGTKELRKAFNAMRRALALGESALDEQMAAQDAMLAEAMKAAGVS